MQKVLNPIVGTMRYMKLTIVYDNETSRDGLIADWGFSCLVESSDRLLLFDTGAKGDKLLQNMNALKVEPGKIESVFISHEHWDHTGGLSVIRNINPYVNVYWPDFSDGVCEFVEDFFTTGLLIGGVIEEQSLILRHEKGVVLIVGCSHPGLERIIKAASAFGKIISVIGGFHGFDRFDAMENIPLIVPCHCTKHKEKIFELFPKTTECGEVGKTIDIDRIT